MLSCPYIGLRPFRESDCPFFFGREREIRVISSNLQGQRLTVLYGPSGVGKSSVLQAGVIPHLKASGNTSVVYFNEWQSPSSLSELSEKCRHAGREDHLQDNVPKRTGTLFLLLDQFEELLLYNAEGAGREFDASLARIVNREDVSARALIGIREDSLSKRNCERLAVEKAGSGLVGNYDVRVHEISSAACAASSRTSVSVVPRRSDWNAGLP